MLSAQCSPKLSLVISSLLMGVLCMLRIKIWTAGARACGHEAMLLAESPLNPMPPWRRLLVCHSSLVIPGVDYTAGDSSAWGAGAAPFLGACVQWQLRISEGSS